MDSRLLYLVKPSSTKNLPVIFMFDQIKEFLSASLDPFSFDIRHNIYILFGLLWGLPIPVASLLFEARLMNTSMVDDAVGYAFTTPLQWISFAHPVVFGIIFGVLGTIRKRKNDEVTALIRELRHLSTVDPLTGLSNRRNFTLNFEKERAKVRRLQEQLSLIMLDLDHFKKVNDTYGHNTGDHVLREVARFLSVQSRPYDSIARWGGEEFVVLLPKTSEGAACDIAERIRVGVAGELSSKVGFPLTVSLGITEYYTDDTLETFTERADMALYQAKESGRNRSVAWSSLEPVD